MGMDASRGEPKVSTQLPETDEEVARITYMYLRWLLVLLPSVLFVVTLWTAFQHQRLEASISAYYGGPVRDVFVGVLIATAACLVAYQGTTRLEDYTLNGAGFYAAFVALVPTGLDEILQALGKADGPDAISPDDYVWFLRIALTTVLGLCALLLWKELRKSGRLEELWQSSRLIQVFVTVTGLVLVAFLALAMTQLWGPPVGEVAMEGIRVGSWQLRIHDLAAILFICALAVAVWTHAWPLVAARHEGKGVARADLEVRRGYQVIFFLMSLGAVAVAVIARLVDPDHVVIIIEWWEILLFCIFWILETRRAGKPSRAGASTDATTPDASALV